MPGGLYKRKGRDGKPLPRWYVWWADADKRRHYRVAYADKGLSLKLLHELEKQTARGELGLVDKFAPHAKRPLLQHVGDFVDHLRAGGRDAKYVQTMESMLRKAFQGMAATLPKDMTTEHGERFLLGLVDERHRSAKTRNDYLAALRQFAQWGVRNGRWPENPFKRIKRLNAEADVRRERRALSAGELKRLLAAAKVRSVRHYRDLYPGASEARLAEAKRAGLERSLIYHTAALTGLRRNELKHLRWRSVDLDPSGPTVTVRAETAKSRRQDVVPIETGLAAALRRWRDLRSQELGREVNAGDSVFHLPRHLVNHFYKDAAEAGIEIEDAAGRVVDFHSLRHSTATLLSRAGVAPRVAQAILRHADITTTMRTYTHVEIVDRARAVEALPSLEERPEEQEARLALAAGAESSCGPVSTHVPTNSWPQEADGGTARHDGREGQEPSNARTTALYKGKGANRQPLAQADNSASLIAAVGLEAPSQPSRQQQRGGRRSPNTGQGASQQGHSQEDMTGLGGEEGTQGDKGVTHAGHVGTTKKAVPEQYQSIMKNDVLRFLAGVIEPLPRQARRKVLTGILSWTKAALESAPIIEK